MPRTNEKKTMGRIYTGERRHIVERLPEEGRSRGRLGELLERSGDHGGSEAGERDEGLAVPADQQQVAIGGLEGLRGGVGGRRIPAAEGEGDGDEQRLFELLERRRGEGGCGGRDGLEEWGEGGDGGQEGGRGGEEALEEAGEDGAVEGELGKAAQREGGEEGGTTGCEEGGELGGKGGEIYGRW